MGKGDEDVYVLLRITSSDTRPQGKDRLAKIVAREAHLQFGATTTSYLCDAAMAKEFVMDGHAQAVSFDPSKTVEQQVEV